MGKVELLYKLQLFVLILLPKILGKLLKVVHYGESILCVLLWLLSMLLIICFNLVLSMCQEFASKINDIKVSFIYSCISSNQWKNGLVAFYFIFASYTGLNTPTIERKHILECVPLKYWKWYGRKVIIASNVMPLTEI